MKHMIPCRMQIKEPFWFWQILATHPVAIQIELALMKMLVKGTSLMHDACLFPLLVTVTNALDCDKRYAMCNVTNGVAVLRCASNCCRIAKSCVANALSFVFDCGSPITLLSSKNMPGTYQYEIIVMAQIVAQIWVFFLKSILADTVSWYMIFSHSMHSSNIILIV